MVTDKRELIVQIERKLMAIGDLLAGIRANLEGFSLNIPSGSQEKVIDCYAKESNIRGQLEQIQRLIKKL